MSFGIFLIWMAGGFVGGTVFSSWFEWAFHRYLMHRRLWKFSYPFERHTLLHHHIFKADRTYHLHREKDKETVSMAWWNGPVLIGLAQIPFVMIALIIGGIPLVCGSLLAATIYYGTYEYIHWCMHVPRTRKVERNGLFFRLNGHHLLHHRYMNKNFNVVFPLFDVLFGTLLLRSRITFAQARGRAVPDVQPRSKAVSLQRGMLGR